MSLPQKNLQKPRAHGASFGASVLRRRLVTALLGVAVAMPVCAEVASPPASGAALTQTPPQVVFEVVLAELALKRNKPQIAMAAYADLALKYKDAEIFQRALEVAAFNRQPELMLEIARLWVQSQPDSPEALNALGNILILLGRYNDAQPVVVRYFGALPEEQRPQEYLRLTQKFPAQADPNRVRLLIDAATSTNLSLHEAQLARAQAAWRAGDEAAALESVRQARKIKPESEAGVLLNAQILAKRSPESVIPMFADYLARYPHAGMVRALYAQQLLEAGRLPEARAQIERLIDQTDAAPESLFAAAAVAMQVRDPALAIQALNRLLQIDSVDKSIIQYNLGLAYETQSDLAGGQTGGAHKVGGDAMAESEAIMHYTQVRSGEYYVSARLRAASLLARQGNMSGARTLLQSTPSADPAIRAELVIGEAGLVSDSGDKAGAMRLVEQALHKDPKSIVLRYELGMMAERAGKLDFFERSMREVIKRDPKYAQAYNALGFTYADKNIRLKEARVLIEKALSLSPNDPFILDSMGWLSFREKNYNVALDYLNKAAALRADPEIIEHQIAVLLAMGRQADAQNILRAGLQQFPDNAGLQALRKQFLSDPSRSNQSL
ncbi:MAG: hypothetical protein ACOYBR_00945 [Fluviibacter sp.]